eukprot:scaffold1589_cov361-Prasinococcus_capsulatus_cf.AAC.3
MEGRSTEQPLCANPELTSGCMGSLDRAHVNPFNVFPDPSRHCVRPVPVTRSAKRASPMWRRTRHEGRNLLLRGILHSDTRWSRGCKLYM